jgi:dCTP deaminase
VAYRCARAFLPGPQHHGRERIDELKLPRDRADAGAVLETNCVYIVRWWKAWRCRPRSAAAANPKSSTGRIDVFTRVIADRTRASTASNAGYQGPALCRDQPEDVSGAGA